MRHQTLRLRTALGMGIVVALACGDDDGATDAGTDADPVDAQVDTSAPDTGDDDAGEADAGADDASPDVFDAGPIGSAGCVDGEGIPEGPNSFMLDGMERRYVMRLPTDYSRDRAWPLIFALHGNGGNTGYWDSEGGSRNIRDVVADHAVLIVAEAIDNRWRDYDMPSDTWPARIDMELRYFDELVNRASADLCIDEDAIFTMGFSGGGSFSGLLGCQRDYIRAFAAGGSVIYFDEEDCVQSPPAWITIGTEELTSGREAFRDFFRDGAGCMESTMSTDPDPCVAYDGCDNIVHYCQHPDGHVWPGFGTEAFWSFFEQFVGE